MSAYPSHMAIALGLAALGRQVLCIIADNMEPVALARNVLNELTDRGGEGFGGLNRNGSYIDNDHSGGRVTFVKPSRLRNNIGGMVFHHMVGEHNIESQEDMEYALSRLRLEVKP